MCCPGSRIYFLGTGSARSYRERDNSFLGVSAAEEVWFIDCAGSPVHKAEKCGFPWQRCRGVILTHLHPDHWYGIPSLLHNLHLAGRQTPLILWIPEGCLDRVQDVCRAFRVFNREDYFRLDIRSFSPTHTAISTSSKLEIEVFPANHSVPAAGVQLFFVKSGTKVIYSGDSTRTKTIEEFAQDADVLIHEASFLDQNQDIADQTGHCTAGEAARLARDCSVNKLMLLHIYRESEKDIKPFFEEAAKFFPGDIGIPQDLEWIAFDDSNL